MKKILYIHGYHGSPNGYSFNNLKNALPDGYSIESVDYCEDSCGQAIQDIQNYIAEHDIDILIGSSLGGFITMLFSGMPRIVINPCYSPTNELPSLGCPRDIVGTYSTWENHSFAVGNDIESKTVLIGCFGDNDELFGNKYHDLFKNNWGNGDNFLIINSGHHVSLEGANQVMSMLPNLEKRTEKLRIYEDALYK